MKNMHDLMKEITELTEFIETEYPELYQYLEETPVEIGNTKEGSMSQKDLNLYLESLRNILRKFIEEHHPKTKW